MGAAQTNQAQGLLDELSNIESLTHQCAMELFARSTADPIFQFGGGLEKADRKAAIQDIFRQIEDSRRRIHQQILAGTNPLDPRCQGAISVLECEVVFIRRIRSELRFFCGQMGVAI